MQDEAGLPQPGDVVGGKYRVERAIGAGGMGAVYRATNETTGKAVALKWLRPRLAADSRAARRFIREAQASARIRHPNVVDIYDVEEQDGTAFLVLELLEGETLRVLLRREVLGVGQCLAVLLPAMRGVAAAHAQGVVHRDIKPDNLFITRDPDVPDRPVPKVLDFGISKLAVDTPLAEGTLTATGATLGTPHYMSLEQLQGAEVDARSDIYAFGVVLYECLTGRRPFDSENFSAIVVKVATETPADPVTLRPDLPHALGDVVLKATARHREDRYQSMGQLVDALLPFVAAEDSPALAPPPAGPSAARSPSAGEATRTSEREAEAPSSGAPGRTLGPAWAMAGMALVVLASAAVWLLPSSGSESPQESPAMVGAATAGAASTPKSPSEPVDDVRAEPAEPAPAATTGEPPGVDAPASPQATGGGRFEDGWVYLGEHDGGRWVTRYFDGWGDGLPTRGVKITARGRSNVRSAMPSEVGILGAVRTTIGSDNTVEVRELARWLGGGYVWARVRAAW